MSDPIRLVESAVERLGPIVGATPEQIAAVEANLGPLPAAYRAFLAWAGGAASALLPGKTMTVDAVPAMTATLQREARDSIDAHAVKRCVAIMQHAHEALFIRLDLGADPQVFRWVHSDGLWWTGLSFSRWLTAAVDASLSKSPMAEPTRRLYPYVGPPEIRAGVAHQPPGALIDTPQAWRAWCSGTAPEMQSFTFIINMAAQLRIADRSAEHVACAADEGVLAAGELTIEDGEVLEVSNQSTGFCPEPSCWDAVQVAFERARIEGPPSLTHPFVFRLCPECEQRNLVKEDWWVCAVCDGDLPAEWNFG